MLETIKNNNKLKTNNYKNLQCLNCGYYGHAIKTCNYPITSYGILCYYIDIIITFKLIFQGV